MAVDESRRETAKRLAELVRKAGSYRWVGLYDVTPDEVVLLAFSGDNPPAHPRFAPTAGLTGVAIETAEPVISNDVATDPRYLTAFDSTGSEMIVPILGEGGRVIGTLDIESDRRDAFGPSDLERLPALRATVSPVFAANTAHKSTSP